LFKLWEERIIYLVNERKKLEELLFASNENYIEKSKVKEKIEELVRFVGVAGMLVSEDEVSRAESQIEVLEELMEDK
jgi:tyrosyl-tRNA synthetase